MAVSSNCHSFLIALTLLLLIAAVSTAQSLSPPPSSPRQPPLPLEYDYYRNSCPEAEKIVFEVMREAFRNDSRITARLLRLMFHDCFIQSGGPFFPLLTGRKDSRKSHHDAANAQIPKPEGTIKDTLSLFSQRGFNEKEVVSLLGAHSIGQIGCEFILNRISNFRGTGKPDSKIPEDFLLELSSACNESPSPSPSRLRNLIESTTGLSYHQSLAQFMSLGSGFGTHYFKSLLLGRGLLFSDQDLMSLNTTAEIVRLFASDDGSIFRREFSKAMLKMSNLQSPDASQGEIRTRCSLPNSK